MNIEGLKCLGFQKKWQKQKWSKTSCSKSSICTLVILSTSSLIIAIEQPSHEVSLSLSPELLTGHKQRHTQLNLSTCNFTISSPLSSSSDAVYPGWQYPHLPSYPNTHLGVILEASFYLPLPPTHHSSLLESTSSLSLKLSPLCSQVLIGDQPSVYTLGLPSSTILKSLEVTCTEEPVTNCMLPGLCSCFLLF